LLHLITTILLGIIASSFGVVIFYALKRINQYELIILNINTTIELIKHQLKMIDDSGHFEADDEVGFFFDELKQLGDELDQLFEITGEVDDEKKEKKEE
jgi:hypothetical protein|tara:strand:+ start:134 stop:430 length:297 start_codon:yes stop_codon:yes gene_type:complete